MAATPRSRARTPHLAPAQRAFLAARAAMDANRDARRAAVERNADVAEIDRITDAHISLMDVMYDARAALYAWVRERLAANPATAARWAAAAGDLDHLFTNAWRRPSVRAQLDELCLKMHPTR